MKDVIICDIDGTLAHMKGRSPYDWMRVDEDTVDETICDLLRMLAQHGIEIVFVSGRDIMCYEKTRNWIQRRAGLPVTKLFMRPHDDNRKDTLIKEEIYESEINGKCNVKFVLDDRDQVVKMWRSKGLKCLQVAEGNF